MVDAGALERLGELGPPVVVPVAEVVSHLFGATLEEGLAVGFVDELVGSLLVLLADDQGGLVPCVSDAVGREHLVDGEPLHGLELLELVDDLLLVLAAQLGQCQRPAVRQGHHAVRALQHTRDVLRSTQHAPAIHADTIARRSASPAQHVTTQERLDAFELVDHRLGAQPTMALALVEVRLDRAAESTQPVRDGAGLRGRNDLVGITLQDEQRRRDEIGDVDRRPLPVRIGRGGSGPTIECR